MKIPLLLANFGLRVNRLYYKQLLGVVCRNSQESKQSWFDHRMDLYYNWPHNLFWLERGFRARKHMFKSCTVLDLCCGDGFYPRYFYSTIVGHVDAADKDPSAIAHAKRWHSHPKIEYQVLDAVKEGFPRRSYDVIAWFESIEHFSEAEYKTVIKRIKEAIGKNGTLVGSTTIVSEERLGTKNWEHKNEFTSVEKLREFFSRDFNDVEIDTTTYPELNSGERRTAYFVVKKPVKS